MAKNILIVAGETSGDIHGSNLVRSILQLDKNINIAGLGGAKMKSAGMEILWDATSHATVGVAEVIRNFSRYASAYRKLVSYVNTVKPDAAVLIDLPDFNLKLASHLHDCGIPIIYYISPQIWAWRGERINKIKKLVRKMLVIFDFEEELYRKAGVNVTFVGHPLLDIIDPNQKKVLNGLQIGLLPASRKEQFKKLFPIIIKSAQLVKEKIPEAEFTLALAPGIDPAQTSKSGIKALQGNSHEIIKNSTMIITASGTATVEALVFETPMIVTYKLSPLTAMAVRPFTKLKNFSMVNVLAGYEMVPEFFQDRAKPELISDCAVKLVKENGLDQMTEKLRELKKRLGTPGASKRAAEEILKLAC